MLVHSVPSSCVAQAQGGGTSSRGWQARVLAKSLLCAKTRSLAVFILAHKLLASFKWSCGGLLLTNREGYCDGLARQADRAMLARVSATRIRIQRQLDAAAPKPIPSVTQHNGNVSRFEQERQLRWQAHFAETCSGKVHENTDALIYVSKSNAGGKF